jgi:hypothetical protein
MSYITLAEMGSSGGLCSQLQIYSSLLSVAKANNKTIVFSEEMIKHGVGIRVFELLDLKYEIKPLSFFQDFQNKPKVVMKSLKDLAIQIFIGTLSMLIKKKAK